MNKKMMPVLAFALVFGACSKEESTNEEITNNTSFMEEQLVQNLVADTGNTFQYTFFSLRAGTIAAREDSNTTKWDLAFQGTTIRVNSGVSGPGEARAQIIEGLYDEITISPNAGFSEDAQGALAIPTGSGNGWSSYDQENHVLMPIPGKVILVESNGRVFKVEILSYYQNAPASPTLESPSRFYTFRYAEINPE